MASGDEQLARAATIKITNTFFDGLIGKIKKISDEESQKMANSMEFILRHRQQFKTVGGQAPRWDPSYVNPNQKLPLSQKSFDKWRVTTQGQSGYYVLRNTTQPEGSFNYVTALVNGSNDWNTKGGVRLTSGDGPFPRLVKGPRGRLYSYQMPEGMGPWINLKRDELVQNISARIRTET